MATDTREITMNRQLAAQSAQINALIEQLAGVRGEVAHIEKELVTVRESLSSLRTMLRVILGGVTVFAPLLSSLIATYMVK